MKKNADRKNAKKKVETKVAVKNKSQQKSINRNDTVTKYGDIGHESQSQRYDVTIVEGQPRAYTRNISPLHTYYKKGLINNEQFAAGAELYRCYYHGAVEGFGVGCSFNFMAKLKASRPQSASDFHWDCFRKYKRGLEAIQRHDYLILRICCHEVPVASIGKTRAEKGDVFAILRDGLDDLARAFGLVS